VTDLDRRRFLRLLVTVSAVVTGAIGARVLQRRDPVPANVAVATLPNTELQAAAPSTTTPAASTTSEASPSTEPTPTTTPVVDVPVICREAWGALPPVGEMVVHTIQRLTVHHTAAFIEDPSLAPGQLRAHQQFHQQTRQWADISYHYLIDPAGNIYEGRTPDFRGDTATEYDPTGHFLVCIDGDFDNSQPNEAQIQALATMLAWGAQNYEVTPDSIAGHRDYAQTSCPGENLYPLIESGEIASRVLALLETSRLDLRLVCGAEAEQMVREIEST
jgi:hypothetical protein